ncbi:LamG domain-containing protein [archaeon]|nr:LamG domain-containing protein [archaeon]
MKKELIAVGIFCAIIMATYASSIFIFLEGNGALVTGMAIGNFRITDDLSLDVDLSLEFKFNNNSDFGENDTQIYDFSNNSNFGKVFGAKWQLKNSSNGSFWFDGIDDYIQVMNNKSFSPNTIGQITISFWIMPATFNFVGTSVDSSAECRLAIVSKIEKLDFYGAEWQFVMYNETGIDNYPRPKRISFYVCNETGGECAGSYFQDNLIKNEWVHVVGVVNGTDTFIYKNGQLRGTQPLSAYGIQMRHTNATLRIGGINGGGSFNGSIDELRIYNKSLSDAEVLALYNSYNFNFTNLSNSSSQPDSDVPEEIVTYNSGNGHSVFDNDYSTTNTTGEHEESVSSGGKDETEVEVLDINESYGYTDLDINLGGINNNNIGRSKEDNFKIVLVVLIFSIIIMGFSIFFLKKYL